MECLFQYPIKTDLTCDYDLEFKYKDIQIILVLRDVNVYTQGKKIRIISKGKNPWDALINLTKSFHEYFDKIVVFTSENIVIAYFEIVLFNERGQIKRTLFYDLIEVSFESDILSYEHNMQTLNNFLILSMDPSDQQALYYLSRAVQSSHLFDKFLNVYHALESITTKSKSYRTCNKCKSLLVCPCCHRPTLCSHDTASLCPHCEPVFDKTSRFERVTENDLSTTLAKIDRFEIGIDISANEILKVRHKCAHPGKKGTIDVNKITDWTRQISGRLIFYLEDKYNIYLGSGGVIKYGTHTGFYETLFEASNADEDFALNVPGIEELKKSNEIKPAKFQ